MTQIVSYGQDFDKIFSGHIIPLDLMSAGIGKLDTTVKDFYDFAYSSVGNNNTFLYLKYTYVISLLMLLLGILTRPAAVFAFICNYCLFFGQELVTNGYDIFMSNSLLFCSLFSVHRGLSLDQYFFSRNKNAGKESYFLRKVLRVTLCVVYVFSGLSKAFDGLGWWNGEKMLTALHFNSSKSSFELIDSISNYPLLLVAGGIITVLLELAYPLIYYVKIRKYMLYSVIAMHVGIAVMLNLNAFSMIMIIWNITAFYDFDEFD
ncbi:hypothetical protein [Hymenobacter arizonensis]|uniref:hypothetical protein n=1 Tax=Hymenobacter arizonensis TaxID=1227077 RepID=UPI001160E16C|nr:hypothetical protein [Hymenobacter arizonensis]